MTDQVRADELTATLFMGEPIEFWAELRANTDEDKAQLIRENAAMRAKVSYFDDMVRRLSAFKTEVDMSNTSK